MQRQAPPHEAETSVKFVFEGDFAPGRITQTTGLEPTRTGAAGDLVSDTGEYRRTRSIWELRSSLPESAGVAEQLESLLAMLEPRWETIKQLGQTHTTGFRIRMYLYEAQGPEFYLSKEVLRRIAGLGADMDVDLYCLVNGDEVPPDSETESV
jgi:hypothetical protein